MLYAQYIDSLIKKKKKLSMDSRYGPLRNSKVPPAPPEGLPYQQEFRFHYHPHLISQL